jgi:hypothetical protein
MTNAELKAIANMLAREVGVLMEDVQHKLDLVVEGHQMLVDKIDRVAEGVASVGEKLDVVALELTAHRNDTEAHRGVYQVREA